MIIKRPMKGEAVDDLSQIQFPCYMSPKVDGFRCILGERPLTSRLAPFRNPYLNRELSGLLPEPLLDGELVVGDKRGHGVLQRTSSGLTNGAGKPDFTFWVFDTPQLGLEFSHRLTLARRIVRDLDHPRIRLLKHRVASSLSDAELFLERCLERGYEGIITRALHGPYKQGKSTLREQWMLKIKPFEDAEGRITGWFEEMENTNEAKREVTGKLKRSSSKAGKVAKGTLGGFILNDCSTGVEVRVGGGFTKEERINLWKLIKSGHDFRGTLVRYKKQKQGQLNKPRHPNFIEFVDFRPEEDYHPYD